MDNNDLIKIIFEYVSGDSKYWKTKYNENVKYINYLSYSYNKDKQTNKNNNCNSFIKFVWDVVFVDLYFIGIFPPKKVKNFIFLNKLDL